MSMKPGNKQERKLAVVMSGGGMRCAYGSGALQALAECYDVTEPDILIAASGSAGPSAYYLSGQERLGALIWIRTASDPRFISFRRRHVIDIDYLIDGILKKDHPLDLAALREKKTRWLLPATRVRDGATVYLKPPRDERVYEYLRAAKAIPVGYGKQVAIGAEEYVDGDFGGQTDDFARKAIAEGGQDVIIIESHRGMTFGDRWERAIEQLLRAEASLRDIGWIKDAATRELAPRNPFVPPAGVRAVTIRPSKPLPAGVATRKRLNLRSAFNLGYADAADHPELRALLASREDRA